MAITDRKPNEVLSGISQLLTKKDLLPALFAMQRLCIDPQLSGIKEEAAAIEKNFTQMLIYFSKGAEDRQREAVLNHSFDRAWTLLAKLKRIIANTTLEDTTENLTPLLEQLFAEPTSDAALYTVFEQLANGRPLLESERKNLVNAMLDESLPEYVRGTLMGGVTLSLIETFDASLVEDLYTFTLDDQPLQMQMEAWVTLVLVALKHTERISYLPRLKEQYALLCEENEQLLQDIQVSLYLCDEAQDLSSLLHTKMNMGVGQEELEMTQEKANELMQVLGQGVDMGLRLFSKMKKIDFFSGPKTRHHWLEPFSLEHPKVKELIESHPDALLWIQMLQHSIAQCETDKYGAFLTTLMMGENLIIEISRKMKEAGLDHLDAPPLSPLWVMRNYLHDLYRYFKMNPLAPQSMFEESHAPYFFFECPWLQPMALKPERLKEFGMFLKKKNNWDMAHLVFDRLVKIEPSEEVVKIYAQTLAKVLTEDKLEKYELCYRICPDNINIVKGLADELHEQKQFPREVSVLQMAIEQSPDNWEILWRLGRGLNHQQREKEALEPLYKADFMKEGRIDVARQLAHALLITGNPEKAERYIDHVLKSRKSTFEDWCLGGAIALKCDNYTLAIQRYRKCGNYAQMDYDSTKDFLLRIGISEQKMILVNETILHIKS